jgi:transposase
MVPKEIRRMSHAKIESSRKRRVFSEEFKQDAVRLVVSEKYSFAAAAKAVGIGEQSLRRWHARLAPKPEPCGENASLDELRAENQRLRRELRRAELEREILKKATAYFAKESL